MLESKSTRRAWVGAAVATLLFLPSADAGTSLGVNRILIVAATGTETENCQSLRDVLGSITDNSLSNRYLVQLEPGTYDCGSTSGIILGEGIALVGSGIDHTRIEGAYESNLLGLLHINGAGVHLRSLSVANQDTSATQEVVGVTIYEFGTNSPIGAIELRDVDIFGTDYGVDSNNASVAVWGSSIVTFRHDGTDPNARPATLRYSSIFDVQLPGDAPAICYFCHNPFSGNTLEADCSEPP